MTLLAFVVFTIAREHGGRFLSGAMLLPCMHRPWQVPTLCLHCTRNVVRMAFCYSSVALLLVLPKFWLAWCCVWVSWHPFWFCAKAFQDDVVFVTVVPCSSCCSSSSAGEFLICISIALDQQQLICGLSYPRLTSFYSNIWKSCDEYGFQFLVTSVGWLLHRDCGSSN